MRTMDQGPTVRQKLLLVAIWLLSGFFGVTTCFPDKVFGRAMSQKMVEEQSHDSLMSPPSVGTPREVDLTYCSVKTGFNDLIDYLTLTVTFVVPLVLGPCAAIIFQVRGHATYESNFNF